MMLKNKRGLIKAGVTGGLVIAIFVFSVLIFSSWSSSAVIIKDVYALGEPVKIDLQGKGDYTVKIKTPSSSFVRQGSNDVFIFRTEEVGTHEVIVDIKGEVESYIFNVLEEETEVRDEILVSKVPDRFDDGTIRYEIESLGFENGFIRVDKNSEGKGFFGSILSLPKIIFSGEEHKLMRENEEVDLDLEFSEIDGEIIISLPKTKALKPGIYSLETEYNGQKIEKEFAFGLISLNTRKSIYRPGEEAEFIMVVLDGQGRPVCGADIKMEITSPSGEKTFLEGGDIILDRECGLYYASHNVEEEGKYEVTIKTVLDNKILGFDTYFITQENYDYEIIRSQESKIDPTLKEKFDVSIEVEALNGKQFLEIKESLPPTFSVIETDAEVTRTAEEIILTWKIYGKSARVSYSYAVPWIWPYLYSLGPLNVNGFEEARPWYVAVDPIAFPGGPVELRAQECDLQDREDLQDSFPDLCAGTYPSSCGSSGDRLSCDDGIIESAQAFRQGQNQQYAGVMIEASNSEVEDCNIISQVEVCYEFWGESSGHHTCTVGVSDDGGTNWDNFAPLNGCQETEPGSVTCEDATTSFAWTCSNFFGAAGTKAMARTQAQRTGGQGLAVWEFDVLFFNVTYEQPPAGDINVILNEPTNLEFLNNLTVDFDYTPTSVDPFEGCTLWENSTGTFSSGVTNSTPISNGTNNFLQDTFSSDGVYLWNVECCSNGECEFAFSNRTFTIDTVEPNVTLVYPDNASTMSDPFDFEFIFNVTDSNSISSCSLYVDGVLEQTSSSIGSGNNSLFQYIVDGEHIWSISCTDVAGNIGGSENRSLTVSASVPAFQPRFWETGGTSLTGNEPAVIFLNGTRDATQKTAAFAVNPAETLNFVEAISHFVGNNGAVIPSGTTIDFSSSFTQTSGNVLLTWKLFITNGTGSTILCKNGDDAGGGTPVSAGTVSSSNSTCISSDVLLQPSDRLLLIINGYNSHGTQPRSVTHAWDGSTSSFVDINITTEGYLDINLTSPLSPQSIGIGETFIATCEAVCSQGRCTNTDVYIQQNTSSQGWQNIGSSGNLILASGETNPHILGSLTTTPVQTNFTLEGNLESVNNIRCIAVSSFDAKNGTTTTQITVSTLEQTPIVELTSPANETWLDDSLVSLFYNATDVNDNIANSTLILNGLANMTNQTPVLNGQINNFTLTLSDGAYNWTVNVTDTTDRVGTDTTRIFYVDTQNPVVSLLAPDDGAQFGSPTVEFNYSVIDNLAPTLSCDIVIDSVIEDSFSAINGTVTNRTLGGLSFGFHLWNVTCTDLAGNSHTSETRNFTIADTPPTVVLVDPPNNYFHNSSTIVLEYNASDNDGLVSSQLILNGQPNITNQSVIINGGTNNFTITLGDGLYNWTVNVTDTTGNSVVASPVRIFTIDTQAPNVTLNLPADGITSTVSTVSFNFTVIDNLDSSLSCTMSVGGAQQSFSATNGSLTNRVFPSLTDGLKTWNVSCLDDAGNSALSVNRQINISEPPSVLLNTANNSFFNISSFDLEYTPSDNTGLAVCSLFLNGVFNQTNQTPLTGGAINAFTISPAEGVYNWSVLCEDTVGLQNMSETRIFTADRTSPQITLGAPDDGENIFSATVDFNYTVTDNISPLAECSIEVNGVVEDEFNATTGISTSRSIFFSTGGLKFWNVSCFDQSGNWNFSETRNFTLSFAPQVDLVTANNSFFNVSTINLSYFVNDDNADIANSTLYLNGALFETNQSVIINNETNNFTITLPDGKYNWTVVVEDLTGLNGTDETRFFTLDTVAPQINLNAPDNDEIFDWNEVDLNFTVIENVDLIVACEISVFSNSSFDSFEVNATNGTETIENVTLSDGDYSWFVECSDLTGNYNISETRNFTVEAPPRVTLLSPVNASMINDTIVSFVYLPEDAIGISECSLYLDGILNDTDTIIDANQNNSFSVPGISEGDHNWTVECTDVFPDFNTFAPSPFEFIMDRTPPNITMINPLNNTNTLRSVNFQFSATDGVSGLLVCQLYLDGVFSAPNFVLLNGSTASRTIGSQSLGLHTWNASCFDDAGNFGWSETWQYNVTLSDLSLNESGITFSNDNPTENESVTIFANVYNLINVTVPSVRVRFFAGDPGSGGTQIGSDQIIGSISGLSNETATVNWNAAIGTTEIFVLVDPLNTIEEFNETNNNASREITVGSWHFLYGFLTELNELELASNVSNTSIIKWQIANASDVKLYATDSESDVSWLELQALGRTAGGSENISDFTALDGFLGMTGFVDSVQALYVNGSSVNLTSSFSIFGQPINNVPLTKSINSSSFYTGILWDLSDDGDGFYSGNETEDVVFFTAINKSETGAYGIYDYEIRVPAGLRDYAGGSTSNVVFYTELN